MKKSTKDILIMLALAILASPMASLTYHYLQHHNVKRNRGEKRGRRKKA